jgi:hypothetical protein
MTRRGWFWLAMVAIPRLLVFPINENLYGDAIARTWLAHLWLSSPHLIGSFDQGGMQFGPLHLYLLAAAEWLWPSLQHAGRLVSLVAGVATAAPLWVMTRRLFGEKAASWALFGLSTWGLHVQCSTTSAGEALNFLFVVWALERLSAWHAEPGRRDALLGSALLLNLACATRYDSWLLVPLIGVVVGWRSRSARSMIWFGALASTFAVAWLFGNYLDRGTPFYPFTYIDDFHRQWFPSEEATWGRWQYRLICLFFWPGSAVVTLTPLLALGGLWGLVRAWRAGQARWLIAIVAVPTLAYTFRSAVMGSFVPLARFTVKEVGLLLPFIWLGASELFRRWPRLERPLVWVGGASAVMVTAGMGALTVQSQGELAHALRPVSATSTNEPRLMTVARWLASSAGTSSSSAGTSRLPSDGSAGTRGSVVIDEAPSGYEDMIVGYFSGFPYEQQARRRSPWFEQRLSQGRPRFVVRWEGGRLEREGRLNIDGVSAWLDGQAFEEVSGFEPPLHVYRAIETPRPSGETLGAQ